MARHDAGSARVQRSGQCSSWPERCAPFIVVQLGLWNWEVSRTVLKGKMFTVSTEESLLPKLLTFVPGLALDAKTELEYRDRVEQASAHV